MVNNILKRGKFKIDVYDSTIHVIICKDVESIVIEGNKVIKKFKEEIVDCNVHALTFSPDLKPRTYYIWLCPDSLDINTITHETDHLRNYILDFNSINENNDTKEASANLNGYINQMIFRFIFSNGYSIKY